ncbi:MAG: NAD(P)H-dependent oxidoreductase subunit E [Clostridia bacterium]|nr:NAD(P)H-dependent oxidoreductase subunit E [Clostridia bacterium]MBQ7048607.1 NAD(P)H-dependent oxidoreductase subunit E [Clostridia bacterium]
MKNKLETLPFKGTPEQKEQLCAIIEEYKDVPGALVQVLKKAQEIYGYLPLEVQIDVAEGLNVPLEEVYGVVTFYSLFSINPKGDYRISVCLGTACYVKGAGDLYDSLQQKLGISGGGCTPDGKFSLEACRCVGACGLAPVITINEDVYGRLTVKDLDDILAKY